MSSITLPVTKIQRFSTKDGPGARTTVFLKGCPLSCFWCHNPETQSPSPEVFYSDNLCIFCASCEAVCTSGCHSFSDSGHTFNREKCVGCMKCADACLTGALEACRKDMTADEMFSEIMKDRAFYSGGGGVTFSGGEPGIHTQKLLPLLSKLRDNNIHICIDTSGYLPRENIEALVPLTDLFLWDIKDTDEDRHIKNTGVSNKPIIENLHLADRMGATTLLRCIMVRGENLNEAHLSKIVELYMSLKGCIGVELIAYHTLGSTKSIQLGYKDNNNERFIPTEAEMDHARGFLSDYMPVVK